MKSAEVQQVVAARAVGRRASSPPAGVLNLHIAIGDGDLIREQIVRV